MKTIYCLYNNIIYTYIPDNNAKTHGLIDVQHVRWKLETNRP